MSWSNIYDHFSPIAFKIFGFSVHWYGIMYVLALLMAYYVAKYFLIKDNVGISPKIFEDYFICAEVGVILGARIGFVLIYSSNQMHYLTHPWDIFNPFVDGKFVGISGMSYHGAVVGFIIATYIFCKKHSVKIFKILDLLALSIPVGYFFGRIGNFLNKELVGRETSVPWAINVDGTMRHPSQIYEAFLEGLVIFLILFFIRKKKKFDGELISIYVMLYAVARFICEFFRNPDLNMGYYLGFLTMGQILSFIMFIIGLFLYIFLKSKSKLNFLKI